MAKLGVNIDHVATVRQARGVDYPDPVRAARLCEDAGCDSIVCHLREDRRHIVDKDLYRLKRSVGTRLNLEMAVAREIVSIACTIRPDQATIVPEKRREVTTEGGLALRSRSRKLERAIGRLLKAGIEVSLFIDPDRASITRSAELGVGMIEIHTGGYANARGRRARTRELAMIRDGAAYAKSLGLIVNAGHGLNYENVTPIARIRGVEELNIGHSIVSYALYHGLSKAVRDMKRLIR